MRLEGQTVARPRPSYIVQAMGQSMPAPISFHSVREWTPIEGLRFDCSQPPTLKDGYLIKTYIYFDKPGELIDRLWHIQRSDGKYSHILERRFERPNVRWYAYPDKDTYIKVDQALNSNGTVREGWNKLYEILSNRKVIDKNPIPYNVRVEHILPYRAPAPVNLNQINYI